MVSFIGRKKGINWLVVELEESRLRIKQSTSIRRFLKV